MLLITIFFYKEPPRDTEGVTLGQKFADIGIALSDLKLTSFLMLLGVFFWLPFWASSTSAPSTSTATSTPPGSTSTWACSAGLRELLSRRKDEDGVRRILGETISHTGYIIMILQVFVSRSSSVSGPCPTFLFGLLVIASASPSSAGRTSAPAIVFLGIFLFAVGEMIASPRIQEYITWIAPRRRPASTWARTSWP
jgi:proton-dependent oligopeptide transporter, POT family